MSSDDRKRQKKLERRSAKRKEKQQFVARSQHAGLSGRLAGTTRFPVLHSWITEDLWTQGIGWALISRQLPNGMVAVGVFLIDRYCLGVKNALADIVGRSTYETRYYRKVRSASSLREVPPEGVRKIVEAAVAYAADLGFAPHADYQVAKQLFGDIDASGPAEEIEFGREGMPYFVAGPNDGPQRCRHILSTLARRCGPTGFHYLIPVSGRDMATIVPEAVRKERAHLVGPDSGGNAVDPPVEFDKETDPADREPS